ncbi:hypothetical protein [Actinomadura meridiana]|uniref:hypothetical protein n=1 Tax=Actinomadura meridiana TaxID=559626 RepID=UPI0031EF45E1
MNSLAAEGALGRAARDVTRGDPVAMGALYDLLSTDAYRLALIACDRPELAARVVEEAFVHLEHLLRAEDDRRGAADLMALTHRTVLTRLLGGPPRKHESQAADPFRGGSVDLGVWSGRPGLSALQSCCVALGCLRLYTTGQIAEMLGTDDGAVKDAMTEGLRALA